jgi:hypothetical protein
MSYRLDPPRDQLRHGRYNRLCYAGAALVALSAALQAALGEWVAAGALALLAGHMPIHPRLRAGWFEAGSLAANPLPRYQHGYVVFARDDVDGDPTRQALMIAANGVHCRALLDVDGAYTDEWIVSTPMPPGARVVQAEIAEYSVRSQ